MTSVGSSVKRGRGTQPRAARGRLVAELLTGSWRPSPPPPANSSRELSDIARLLLRAGAGALAWGKVRNSDLRDSLAARKLQRAYRVQSLQAELQERCLKEIIAALNNSGVDAVLVKGWAIARLYPEPGMRPYGDYDLCVLPDQYERARKILNGTGSDVDLHMGFGKFYDRQAEAVFARSELAKLGDMEVRVLCAEDHLRFLCLHLLRHGAVRPPWLCDIGLLIETRSADFDWDIVLRGSPRQADWVACTVGLAHQLLGADVEGTPISSRAQKLPGWLLPAVLEEWGVPFRVPAQVALYLRHPARQLRWLLEEIPHHWPNPVEATMTLEGPFNELPRLPFQVGHVFSRAGALLSELVGSSRGRFTVLAD